MNVENKVAVETVRGEILSEAKGLTHGQRSADYGGVFENHKGIARLFQAYLESVCEKMTGEPMPFKLAAEDIAHLMILLKVQRTTMANHVTRDHYVDIAAYAGIAGELAYQERDDYSDKFCPSE